MTVHNGENHHNNAVVIDFDNRKIDFTPVTTHSDWMYWLAYFTIVLTPIFLLSILIWGAVFVGYLIVDSGDIASYAFGGFTVAMLLIIPVVIAFFYSLMFFDPYFRRNIFPKANERWILLSHGLIDSKEEFVVNPDAIMDNKLWIPRFSNVSLSWDATGDYSFYLKKVYVKNYWFKNDEEWFAIFEFSQKPVDGEMKVTFV